MESQLRPGDLLDNRYRIGETIARGGMSVVYHCVDTRLDRDLAAKVLDPGFARSPRSAPGLNARRGPWRA